MDEELGIDDDDDDGVDRISSLPKEILYHILYFLPKREAAQTCVLSKSWRFLWTNRLKVSFRELSYLRLNRTRGTRLFISRVNNFLHDYHNHHPIEEFRLFFKHKSESISLLKKWIPMLTSIGVKDLFLYINPPKRRRTSNSSSSKREQSRRRYMDLPLVVFKSECLAGLYLDTCNLRSLPKNFNIHCVRLNELVLLHVKFIDDERICHDIISSCPLITTLCFRECQGLKTIELVDKHRHKYLKHFSFINYHTYPSDECSVEIRILPTLETIDVVGSKIRFRGRKKFSHLKKLYLSYVKFSGNSFDCSSCYEFPRLGSLTFSNCYGWEQFEPMMLQLNAPWLLYFHCMGRTIPSITFTTPMPRACRSDIRFPFFGVDPQSWFLKLSGLLQVLSQSQIFLSVYQHPTINVNFDIGGNYKPEPVVVEQLQLNMGHLPSFPCYLNCLFSICRPRYIAQIGYIIGGEFEKERDHRELTQFLCNFLTKKTSESGNQEVVFRHDLEELTIESFDMSREQWMPESVLPESNRIRFRLKWSEACDDSSSS